jgi:hypothetical protein
MIKKIRNSLNVFEDCINEEDDFGPICTGDTSSTPVTTA